jgi:hypothetical protein
MNLELIGWKAWYPNNKIYTSLKHKFADIPRNELLALKKFYRIKVNDEYIKDELTGKDIFYEIITGHKIICLSIEEFERYKKLPRCLKFGSYLEKEEFDALYKIVEEDQEEPWMKKPLSNTKKENL